MIIVKGILPNACRTLLLKRRYVAILIACIPIILISSSTFAAATRLQILTTIPDTLCPGSSFEVCIQLTQNCGAGGYIPLPDRPVLLFINTGNCGIPAQPGPDDTVFTNAEGIACAALLVPITKGASSVRALFEGEAQPGPTEPPNGVCEEDQRVQLSESNACQIVQVESTVCHPPTATCPGDTTLFLCSLQQVCLGGFGCSDEDADLASCAVSFGTLNGDQVCFTPSGEGPYPISLIAADDQGFADTCETVVTVVLNDAPTAVCPGSQNAFVCSLNQICLPGFTCSDPNDNIASVDIIGGVLDGNQVCFTPVAGNNLIKMIVTDLCGLADTCETNVTVAMNHPPAATCPGNLFRFVCDLNQLCIDGFSCSDPDNNIMSVETTGGILNGSQICFDPVEGSNVLELVVVDSCGVADTCETVVTVDLNNPPVAICPGNCTMVLCNLNDICLPGFYWTDPDDNITAIEITGGILYGNQVCFTPVPGPNVLKMIVTDSCGVADTCQTTVSITLNSAPVAVGPEDQALFQCELEQVCIAGFGWFDANNNIADVEIMGGTLDGNQVCLQPVAGINNIRLIVTDSCGLADTCETSVTVNLNSAPVANCPGDQNRRVCDLSQICIDGFSYGDPDNNIENVTVIGGILNGNQVCFTPVAGASSIKLIVTDFCGLADTCETIVMVTVNGPPVVSCCGNDTRVVCNLGQICLEGFAITDPNNNLASVVVAGGTLYGNTVCLTPVEGPNLISLIATDSCSVADTCETVLTVNLNDPPTVICPGDTSLYVFSLNQICLPGFNVSDPDNNLSEVVVTGGTLINGTVCLTPIDGINVITISATDACGAVSGSTTVVDVHLIASCPIVRIEKTTNTLQGRSKDVAVILQNATYDIGMFNFLLAYDALSIAPIMVTAGEIPDDCEWEYFTYRFGPFGDCGSECPSGMLRIFSLADIAGVTASPDCFGPADAGPHTLATIRFMVSSDWNLNCQFIPIKFFWLDCSDNVFAGVSGDTTFVDSRIFEFDGGTIWDEGDDVNYPENTRPVNLGTPDDPCMIGQSTEIMRCIDFVNGGIGIVCSGTISGRGDINLNGIPYEIADAVVFTNYLIYGLSAFEIDQKRQIAATEINDDGILLAVADLYYMIRVIVGDAQAIPKIPPYSEVACFGIDGSVVSVDRILGGAYFVFDGRADVSLAEGAGTADLMVGTIDGNTVALVIDLDRATAFSGSLLNVDGTIKSIQACDADGNLYKIEIMSKTFNVRNYPNPFNPCTVIEMFLPVASDWAVSVYNVVGQKVYETSGHDKAGTHQIVWNAAGHASGIYFYKIEAGGYSATSKMVLMK